MVYHKEEYSKTRLYHTRLKCINPYNKMIFIPREFKPYWDITNNVDNEAKRSVPGTSL